MGRSVPGSGVAATTSTLDACAANASVIVREVVADCTSTMTDCVAKPFWKSPAGSGRRANEQLNRPPSHP